MRLRFNFNSLYLYDIIKYIMTPTTKIPRTYLTEEQAKDIVKNLSSEGRAMISTKDNDLCVFRIKPARKGEIFGNGAGTQPRFKNRIATQIRDFFKQEVN